MSTLFSTLGWEEESALLHERWRQREEFSAKVADKHKLIRAQLYGMTCGRYVASDADKSPPQSVRRTSITRYKVIRPYKSNAALPLSLSLKRTFGHFEQPLPMSLDLGIQPLALQQAKQLCQMHFRYTYGTPSIMQARLHALRVTHMMASPQDGMEHRIRRVFTDLDMGALYPSLAPLPWSVSGHTEKILFRMRG